MPRKSSKKVIISCCKCKAKSRPVDPPSPAAPVLTALEVLHKESGWAYQVGFFSMLSGEHYPLCPACVKTASDLSQVAEPAE